MKEERTLVKRSAGTKELQLAAEAPSSSANELSYGYAGIVGEETHLRYYWRAVRKRLWLVVSVVLLVTSFVAIYMARKPDTYEARARVEVDVENSNLGLGGSRGGSILISNPISDPVYFNTQLQILTSQGLLRRVAKTLDLENNQNLLRPQATQNSSTWRNLMRMFGFRSGAKPQPNAQIEVPLTETVAPAPAQNDLAEAKRLAPYVAALQSGLKAEPVKDTRLAYRDTRLIDIRFTHTDPQIAAKVANTIADTFTISNLERKTKTNSSTGDFLQRRIAELQAQIRSGEERLINYAKSNQILSLDASQNTVVDRLTGLNRQLLEAENERKLAESAYRAALAPGAASALAESDAKQINEMESRLAEQRQKRAQLLVENTEEWPEVKEVNQQISTLEQQVKDARNRAATVVLTNLETRYRQAQAREQSLRAAFERQRSETLTQNEAAVNYRILQQEIETNKNLLDGLLQRAKENDVVLAGAPNNIYVVDYALAPDYPIGPQRLRAVWMALAFSLALGVGLALLMEYMDDTIHSTDDVERMLRLPALAVIPKIGVSRARRLMPSASALQRINDGGGLKADLLINADPRSSLAEAYRHLRTSVLLSTAGRAPKTLLVTSSVPAEGKTTTAVNFATSLAQTGASVVAVDADMRRPRVHNVFELENRQGLSTVLSSDMTEAEMLSLVQQDKETGLYVLTSGPIPPNPAELIGSDQMRRLIATLEATFKHVVIDSPPTASFTDSALLSSMVDGVLLVVHGGKSSRDVVRRTRQVLQDVGAKILGVVLNNAKLHPNDYYYYHSYYSGSYYKSDADSVA